MPWQSHLNCKPHWMDLAFSSFLDSVMLSKNSPGSRASHRATLWDFPTQPSVYSPVEKLFVGCHSKIIGTFVLCKTHRSYIYLKLSFKHSGCTYSKALSYSCCRSQSSLNGIVVLAFILVLSQSTAIVNNDNTYTGLWCRSSLYHLSETRSSSPPPLRPASLFF